MREREGGSRHLCAGQGEGLNPSDAPPQCEAVIPTPPTLRSIPGLKQTNKQKSGGERALRFFSFFI